MKIAKKSLKCFWWIIPMVVLISVVIAVVVFFETAHSPVVISLNLTTDAAGNNPKKPAMAKKPVAPVFNKSLYSITDPQSLWIIVNKQHPLDPIGFAPSDLIITVGATISSRAQADFEAMNNDALAQGINFTIVSSYRSYWNQSAVYNNYVATYGQASTDTFSARPGYSEHQTGLTVDLGSSTGSVCNLDDCFGTTAEGQWLAANAYKYGFIMRYPSGKQLVTGYKPEPWHYRYVGRELATEMNKQSITTMEEFFGISGGEKYV